MSTTTIVQPTVVNASNNLSAASWGAIVAGAVAAASLSLILFILGTGLGLSSVSPWSGEGISAETFGLSTIGWITFTALAASALGGYITGRLRTRWVTVDRDEVYFRDTAHGFLAWGVATLLTATLLTSVSTKLAGATAGAAVDVVGAGVGGAVAGAGMLAQRANTANDAEGGENASLAYFLDSLFRRGASASGTFTNRPVNAVPVAPPQDAQGSPATDQAPEVADATSATRARAASQGDESAPALAEVNRIVVRGLQAGSLADQDRRYVAQRVADYTGMSSADAEARVTEVFTSVQTELREAEASARQAADEARAVSAKVALWFFVSLLAGAFVSSFAATFGGKQRDQPDFNV